LNINYWKNKGKKFVGIRLVRVIIKCLNLKRININIVSIYKLVFVNVIARRFILYYIFIVIRVNINNILLKAILVRNEFKISISGLFILIPNY